MDKVVLTIAILTCLLDSISLGARIPPKASKIGSQDGHEIPW